MGDHVDRRLVRAARYVTRDLSRHPSLADVARIAGLERCYFCKLFQLTFGVGFSVWNRCIRIEHASVLLRNSCASVTAIAMSVGFENLTTFERNFKKCTSLSPHRYRRMYASDLALLTRQHLPKISQ